MESLARQAEPSPKPRRRIPAHLWQARALRTGQLIDQRYRLIASLGEGGMATVWRAVDQKLGRDVAIKFTKDAAREAHVLNRSGAGGVVTAYSTGDHLGTAFLVMRVVDGRCLEAVLGQLRDTFRTTLQRPTRARDLLDAIGVGVPPGRQALLGDQTFFDGVALVVGEVLRALDAVHAAGLVHHDIKPANLILEGGGQPVLVDFGLAESLSARPGPEDRHLPGTVMFMTPEDLRRGYTIGDVRGDLYQVGLVLYEMLTLQRCYRARFPGDNVVDRILRGDCTAPHRIVATVPASLEAVCLRAIHVDPAKRFQSAAEFRQALRSTSEPIAPSRRTWLFRRLRPW